MDACPDVRCSTDDLQRFGGTDEHPADTELVGIGMGLAILHEAHHHTGGAGGEILDLLHLKAGDRKPFRQQGRLQGLRLTVHKLAEPLERNPHPSDHDSRRS